MGEKDILQPKQVISDPTSIGVSEIFTAQWYPDVVAQIVPSIGLAGTIKVTLKGSLVKPDDKTKGVTVIEDTFVAADGTTPQKLVKPAGEWWLYYWLEFSEPTNAWVTEAWIGAGGA